MEAREFNLRREKLLSTMPDHAAIILFSGSGVKCSADEEYPFVVNKNFYYLTGVTQANSALIILKVDKVVTPYLFIEQPEEIKEKWTGRRLSVNQAYKISGIENVLFTEQIDSKIATVLSPDDNTYGRIDFLYFDLELGLKIRGEQSVEQLKNKLAQKYPHLVIEDVYPKIVQLRMLKSPNEIAAIRKAISFTNTGLKAMLTQLKPEMFEYQARALFEYVIGDRHNAKLAFATIAASGVNATILHYPTPNERMKDGQLLLLDLGAANELYSSDISRTYPVSGQFNGLQKAIYEIVLACNKAVIEMIKPGLTLLDLQKYTIEFLSNRLLEENLIKSADEISKYYYHSVSHHLGLDTHDPADRQLPLAPGNVITVEPGLYFKEYGIGVRIEDDVLVTLDGSENLSKAIIKEVKDIEKALIHRK
ncbi:MAG: aminopeptidase P N-terminal domain-containing protein [Bacilli bacterium]